jgi:membrane protein implicated in regulation of membrane protease activity
MKHINPSPALRTLARMYRRTEDAGFPDLFLIVVCAAGGLATGGVALLAFVPTHATLLVAYVLVIVTTSAVLLTVLVMVNGEEGESDRSSVVREDRSAPVKRAISRSSGRRRVRDTTATLHA